MDTREEISTPVLLDSGCKRSTIDTRFVKKNNITTKVIDKPYKSLQCRLDTEQLGQTLCVPQNDSHRKGWHLSPRTDRPTSCQLGQPSHNVFIGKDWLNKHNLVIDWRNDDLVFTRCPHQCGLPTIHVISCGTGAIIIPDEPEIVPLGQILDKCDTAIEALLEGEDEYIRRVQEYYEREAADDTTIRAHGSIMSDLHAKAKRHPADHQVPDCYNKFASVFNAKEFDHLPPHQEWDHKIELREGWQTNHKLQGKLYNLDHAERAELEKFIQENKKTGRIGKTKQGNAPIAAPFFFVKKKSNELRPVQDYRRINASTVKDVWPLPLISKVMNKIKDAKVFSKMDVHWGFNNVRIRKGDEFKATFTMHLGTYEPTVMFFCLTYSPATFQCMMDHIFHDLIKDGKIIVYMDDILVFSTNLEEHQQVVNTVLQRLQEHSLFLKPEKCQFEKAQMDFFGMVIGNGKLCMDPIKTKAVSEP